MQLLTETLGLEGWPGGVIPATDASLLGPAASPRGENSALALSTTGVPYVQKRMGLACQNSTPIAGSPAIIGQQNFYKIVDDTTHRLVIADNGTLNTLATDGTVTEVYAGLTPGSFYPSFAIMNDLCFITNGVNRGKYDGSGVSQFGIVRPVVGALAGAAGAAGSPSGTYELRVTYANSVTGAESSASDNAVTNVTVSSQAISVTGVPVSSDSQVDTRYVYIRNTATQIQFYLAGTISNNVGTTITLDFVDADLVTIAPGQTQNNQPPSGVKYLAAHQGRMFAASDTALYYSRIDMPEAFSAVNVEYVDQADGQPITGIVSDHEILIIFKEDKVYGLFNGNDPASWQIRLISSDFGCASARTIRSCQNWTIWWSRHGLVRWNGSGEVDDIGLKLYGDPSDRVNYGQVQSASACYDEGAARYLVSVPEAYQDRATMILPFNVQLGVFESTRWDPMDASSLGEFTDPYHVLVPFLGNYAGQVFRLNITNNDAIAPLTSWTGTFVQSGTTLLTLTDAGATFDTTGGGLIERKLTILDSNGIAVTTGSPRPRILSNTGTTLTLTSTLGGLVSGSTYTYIVGGPNFRWDSTWRFLGLPWVKKRFEYLFMNFKGYTFDGSSRIEVMFDWNDVTGNPRRLPFTSQSAEGAWDASASLWDSTVWDLPSATVQRFRMARTGRAYQVHVFSPQANQPFGLLYLGAQAVAETVKN